MRFLRFLAATLAAAVAAVTAAGPAWAHNALVEATPAKNAVLTKPPKGVELRFLQKLDDRFLTIVVTGPERQKIATGTPEADGQVGSVAFTGPLPNGEYTVAYRVVSRDGHPVQGSYAFSVKNPAPVASPSSPSPSPSSVVPAALAEEEEEEEEEESTPWWPVAAAVAGVVLVVAGGVLAARRRH